MKINFVFLLCLILYSCQSSKKESKLVNIDVNATSDAELSLSENFQNFQIVKLSSDAFIGEIKKIQYNNNKIYITDGHSIFIFSETGDLLSCFDHTGKGPYEYQDVTDFIINGEDVIILNRDNKNLLKYHWSGKFILEYKIEYWTQAVSPIINHRYLLYCGNELGYDNKHKLHLLNETQMVSQFLPIDANKAKYLHMMGTPNFFKYQDTVRFFEMFNDTIYSIKDDKIEPTFYVNYDDKGIPQSFFEKKYNYIYEFFQDIHQQSYAYGIAQFAENNKKIMLGSYYEKNLKLTIYDKQNKTSNTFAAIKDDIFFESLMIPANDFNCFSDEYILFPVDAPTIIEWRDKYKPQKQYDSVINVTKENDNPVLFIFKLKS